jgi:hypothetical protein
MMLPAYSEEQKKEGRISNSLIYPENLLEFLIPFDPIADPTALIKKQEFVEIESQAYPGLYFDLPEPEEFLTFQKFELRPIHRSPTHYQTGGPVLSYFGVAEPGGLLISTPVPLGDEEKEKE